jgi:hypothetical protein
MNWKVWDRKKITDLSSAISEYLVKTYSLPSDQAAKLQMACRSGKYVGDSTTYVRVFDPSLVRDQTVPIRSYQDLNAAKGAVLFEGRWQSGRFVDVNDLRKTAA